MRPLFLAALLFPLFSLSSPAATPARAASCQFALGFATLRAAIPDAVGDCLDDLSFDARGNARQETSAWHGKGGTLFWRKADNWTGFTDGYQTWTIGRGLVEQRLNTERFAWESDRLVTALRNTAFRLPLGSDPRNPGQERAFPLTDGLYDNREERMRVQLIEAAIASGDLNADGMPDAVALVAVNSGGSGVFMYAVAMIDQAGKPVQAGYEFLGDRVRVSSFTIREDGQIIVDMFAHGPGDPACCPNQRALRTLDLRVPMASGLLGGTPIPLEGTRWKLESFTTLAGSTVPALPGTTATAQFGAATAEGRALPYQVSGRAGCNTYGGRYEADGRKLKIGPIASTKMACAGPVDVMAQEDAYLGALAIAASYVLSADKLEIAGADGKTIMTLVRD